jgi:hypothetical protein
MNRTLCILSAAALIAAGVIVSAAEGLRIMPLVHDDWVLVSTELPDGYSDELHAAIASGLRTTITYDLELRTIVPIWLDRTIAAAVVSSSDQYDNLTRRHSLTRTVDGRVDDALITEDEAVAKRWLTTLNRLRLCPTSRLDVSRDYYVRIRARTRPAGGSLLGWAAAVTGQAKFTFLP